MTEITRIGSLKGLSAQQLRRLAKRALKLAEDLEKEEPSYRLALEAGVRDTSYDTTANGFVWSYSGEAIIEMPNGRKWKAIGHRPEGDAWSIYKQGYIEFIPIE